MILQMIYFLAQQGSDQPLWLILVLAFIASGGVTAGLNYIFNRRRDGAEGEKIDADTADILQRAAGELVEKVRAQAKISEQLYLDQNKILLEQIALLQVEVAKIPELEASISDLKIGISLLTEQLKEHGIQPVYPPVPPTNF